MDWSNISSDVCNISDSGVVEANVCHADPDMGMSKQLLINIFTFLLIFVCLAGVLGNLLSVYVYTRKEMINSSINILLLAMSIVDLIICAIVLVALPLRNTFLFPWAGRSCGLTFFQNAMNWFGLPALYFLQNSSIWLLIAVTLERYLAVCHPLTARIYDSTNKTKGLASAIVLTAFLYNIVRLWEDPHQLVEHCVICTRDFDLVVCNQGGLILQIGLHDNILYKLVYNLLLRGLTQFVVPVAAMVVLYAAIIRAIGEAQRQRRGMSRAERSTRRTIYMLLTVTLVFVVSFWLLLVIDFVDFAQPYFGMSPEAERLYYEWFMVATWMSNFFVTFNAASNAFVYYAFSERYRAMARRLIPFVKAQLGHRQQEQHDTLITMKSVANRSRRSNLRATM